MALIGFCRMRVRKRPISSVDLCHFDEGLCSAQTRQIEAKASMTHSPFSLSENKCIYFVQTNVKSERGGVVY